MKKTLLLLSVFTTAIASAQLTQTNEPAIGDIQTMYVCDTSFSDLGSVKGGSAVWDFTGLNGVSTGATRTVEVKNPTSVSAQFPSAQKAIDIQDYLTSFFASSTGSRNSKGMQFVQPAPLGTIKVILDDANDEKIMEYPYNFGNAHVDAFTGQVKSDLINTTCTGKGNFTIDGKGTLKLNATTTLNNVLRYRLQDTVDATVTTPFPATIKIIRTQYEYYDLDNSKELPVFIYANLRLITTGSANFDVKQKLVLNSVKPNGFLGLDNEKELAVSVYPNPTTGIIHVSGVAADAVVTIKDLQGKVVFNNVLTNNQISMSEFQAGIYVMEVVSENGVATQRIVKN